jgi:ubiquinone/menaquinone biosynthesis C-methylase UbiE
MGVTNFDERAKDWDSDPLKVERARIVAEYIRSVLPLRPGMSALEYGCGTGLLSFALQADFASLTLADTSQGMLDVLSAKITTMGTANMHPLRLDMSVDSLPVARYHIVYSLMTLHHIPDTAGILRKFHAVLEPGGWLAAVDLDMEDGSFHGAEVKDVHRGFDREKLQILAETAGFTQVRFTEAYTISKLVGKVEKNFPLFLMTAEKNTA